MRRALDGAGFPRVKLVASSGFTPAKCKSMAVASVPVDRGVDHITGVHAALLEDLGIHAPAEAVA